MNNLIATKIITVKSVDKKVQIFKLNASEGIVLGTKLLKLILPVLGGFADEIFSEDKTEQPKTFSEMATRILQQIDNVDLLTVVKKLFDGMSVDGKAVVFDEYFMANYGEMLMILEFALRENFESFFEAAGLKARFLQAVGMTDSQAESDGQ